MLDESTHLFELLVTHYGHRIQEPTPDDLKDRGEESLIVEANSVELERKLRALLDCEHPRCSLYRAQYEPEILEDVLEFVGDLFTDESRTQIANAIVESRSKPPLDPKTSALAADLRAIVAETLKIAREETKT